MWTYAQKMAATSIDLTAYKDSLLTTDPDYASAVAHTQYRTDLNAHGNSIKQLAKLGPGSNPIPPPPTPPGV
jgi:hypothetical protein